MSNTLSILTFLPLLGALLVALIPARQALLLRAAGIVTALAALAFSLVLAVQYDRAAGSLQYVEQFAWIPSLHIEYYLAADGLSLLLLVLTGIVTLFALLALGARSTKLGVSLILVLETTLFGTFTALNFIHWFLFYELSLVPAFFLIRMGGSAKATAAATQFFIYTLFAGFAMLLGFLAIHQATATFNLTDLAALAHNEKLGHALSDAFPGLATHINLLVFGGIFLGLAVKVPVVPFHTWLPDAYTEAPAPVSMLLTGLLSKMGVYGFLRLLFPLFPGLMRHLAWPLFGFALVTIIYAALAALAQKDLKRIVAYSSINHLGYCLLGLFAASAVLPGVGGADPAAAMNGVLLQIFNHGLTAAALFCFIGFIELRSGGLRGLNDFGGLRDAAPVLAGLMGIALFSSLGLPGLNGFPGEFLIFKGTFALAAWPAALAAIGLFVTAVFLLTLIERVFTGPLDSRWLTFPDLTAGERFTVAPAIALMFIVGICPQILIALFNQTVLHLLR
ncbi:MAG: NADH-quinone oxidoreductase subunit M [Chthoniobacteraceae bacterium]|nr:NADH-quinone oxidoreductase subunit M [Chthoniobacteraceae bacterium]